VEAALEAEAEAGAGDGGGGGAGNGSRNGSLPDAPAVRYDKCGDEVSSEPDPPTPELVLWLEYRLPIAAAGLWWGLFAWRCTFQRMSREAGPALPRRAVTGGCCPAEGCCVDDGAADRDEDLAAVLRCIGVRNGGGHHPQPGQPGQPGQSGGPIEPARARSHTDSIGGGSSPEGMGSSNDWDQQQPPPPQQQQPEAEAESGLVLHHLRQPRGSGGVRTARAKSLSGDGAFSPSPLELPPPALSLQALEVEAQAHAEHAEHAGTNEGDAQGSSSSCEYVVSLSRFGLTQGVLEQTAAVVGLRAMPDLQRFILAWVFLSDASSAATSSAALILAEELCMSTLQIGALAFVGLAAAAVGVVLAKWAVRARLISPMQVLWLNIVVLTACGLWANWAVAQWEVFAIALVGGLNIGTVGSFSRSVFVTLVPRHQQAKLAALFEFSQKGTSWLAPLAIGIAVQQLGDAAYKSAVVIAVMVEIAIGFPLLLVVDASRGAALARAMDEAFAAA
jgi:hypothetical protein